MPDISIIEYKTENASELLRLLLELHVSHFQSSAAEQIRELGAEHDIRKSYSDYVNDLNSAIKTGEWRILLAKNSAEKIIGFIIGRITEDEALVRSRSGILEDWFVETEYRGAKIGMRLYAELENWFREKGCQQIISETWQGNEESIGAHKKSGFFVSGIIFSKKLD